MLPHIPPELQVWTPLPEHCVEPGEHVPAHAPMTHAEFEQATGAPHVPLAVHDWTLFPEHCVWPGAQTPVHTPLMHVSFVHAAGAPQLPLPLQVCTPFPRHCVAPGEQATHALFKHAGVDPEQVVCVCQVPVAVHD